MQKNFSMLLIIFSFCCLPLPTSATENNERTPRLFLKKSSARMASIAKEAFSLSGKILKRVAVASLGYAMAYGTIIATGLALKQINILPQSTPLTPAQLKKFFGTIISKASAKAFEGALTQAEATLCNRLNNIEWNWLHRKLGIKEIISGTLNCSINTLKLKNSQAPV